MTESETEKNSVLASSEHKEASTPVDSDSPTPVCDISASHSIPRTVLCDKPPVSGTSKVTDRWVGMMDEKLKPEQLTCVSKPSSVKSTKETSPFNDETLALIREIGSVLVNSPAKPDDTEMERLECSNVKMVVRQIEMQQGQYVKQRPREIIIIEDTSKRTEDTSKDHGTHLENCPSSTTKVPSIVQSAGSVFGLQGFHSTDSISQQQIKNKTVEGSGDRTAEVSGIRDDAYVHPHQPLLKGDDLDVAGSHSVNVGSADRKNLCLNLFGDKSEGGQCQSEDMLVDDVVQAPTVCSLGSSPRADSDHSVVRHLVGRFEKDVKGPVSEKVETVSGRKYSSSFSESPISKDSAAASATDSTGSTSTESPAFQARKDSYTFTSKPSEKSTTPRLSRPKSADHAESRQCKSSGEQVSRLKRQGNVTQWLPEGSEVHQFGHSEEPDEFRKVRCLQGKSHPLTKLNARLGSNPFYNTM